MKGRSVGNVGRRDASCRSGPVRAGSPAGWGQWVRNWRVLTAIAAVVLAALAGVLVWKYTDNAKKDAEAPFTMQSVMVAAQRVPANTSFESALANKLIVRADRVKNDLPETRVVDDSDENLVAAFKAQV